ncbi:MAG: hypothetical protein Rubg2KO_24600 [Rubricoccaceae bacterium]
MTRSLFVAILAVSFSSVAQAQSASFERLTLFGGTAQALGTSGDGTFVVGTGAPPQGGMTEAYRWTDGTAQKLGVPPGFTNSYGTDVSADGLVVVGYTLGAARNVFRWTSEDGMQVIGTGEARTVSSDGTIVAGYTTFGESGVDAFRWTDATGMQPLGALPDGNIFSRAYDMSDSGDVIVGSISGATSNNMEAFRWTPATGVVSLGVLQDDHQRSEAFGVSPDGKVVVGRSTGFNRPLRAFRWSASEGMQDLGAPANGFNMEARATSLNGEVVVGLAERSRVTHGTYWSATRGMQWLDEELVQRGLDLTGLTRLTPADVSADGQVIVGTAIDAVGRLVAWRAVLPQETNDIVVTTTGDEPNDPASASADECDVDRDMEEAQCTLRAALELANARGGGKVAFEIPGDGVPVISVGADALPNLSHRITIDGTTQPGGWVELAGPGQDAADPLISGISVQNGGAGSTLRGLVIHGFKEAGVYLNVGADGCTLEGNRIGTDATGLLAKGNGGFFGGGLFEQRGTWAGVWIESHDNRIIGNIIAGNVAPDPNGGSGGTDVLIRGSRNILEGNNIGVGADGIPLVLPARSVDDRYTGVWIYSPTGEIFGNRIGGPGEIGGEFKCATPQCNTIQGHHVEILQGSATVSGAFAGRGTVISGNVIGSGSFNLPEGAILTGSAINDTNSPSNGIAEDTRVAFNYILATETGISIRGSDSEVLGNTVSVGARPRRDLIGAGRDHYWAIEMGPDATVTQNTVSSAWIGVSAERGTTVSNNRFTAARPVLVRSPSPVVIVSQNSYRTISCDYSRVSLGMVHLGGNTYNPHWKPIARERRNDWGDTDGFANSPIIVRAERSGDQVQILGYVRTSPTVSDIAVEMNACGSGDYITTHTTPTSVGVTEFEITLTDFETETFTFTATHDGESTSEGVGARIAPQASISSLEIPSTGVGASASGQGADLTVVAGSQGRTSRQAGARVFITRFNTQPDTSVFADTTATAPNGESIRPEAVAFRTWVLRDIGLSRESVDPAVAATFDVCFEVSDDVVHPEQQTSVVLVQRSSQGFDWQPLDTVLEPRDGTPALCARSVETLGEFGFGGAEGAFPVSAEPDDAGALPSVLALRTFPNPASGLLSVEGAMPQAGTARVTVHDALGREVAVLQDGPLAAGTHRFSLETAGLAPGLYHVRLSTPGGTAMQRVTVVR